MMAHFKSEHNFAGLAPFQCAAPSKRRKPSISFEESSIRIRL
jgi:hypothetical protein